MTSTSDRIRRILETHGQLPIEISRLSDDDDLHQNGLTSHACVNVMLAIEDAFGVEFPDSMLRKSTFQSVTAIVGVLKSLEVSNPPHYARN